MKSLLLAVCLACTVAVSWASTEGTNFHIVFLENVVERPQDGPLEVHVSNTRGTTAVVTVSSPKTSCASQTLSVSPGSSVRFDVCWWMRAVASDYWPAYKTIVVTSTSPVAVHAYNQELYSADGFFVIPTSELSTSYYIGAYDDANIATQFAVSAVEETDVAVTLPSIDGLPVQVNHRGILYTNGETFTITLQQYETFLAQSRGDMTGAKVLANKPIAVFSGNIRNKANSGSRDHLADQMVGTGDWSTTYALRPVPRTSNFGDMVRVIALRANTQFRITQSDTSFVDRTLSNPGDFFEIFMTSPLVISSLSSLNPIQVLQMVRSQSAPRIADVADPAMFLLVPADKFLNSYISPALIYERDNIPYQVNYAMLTINSGFQNGLRVNGNQVDTSGFSVINGLAFGWVSVSNGGNTFSHTSNVNFGVMVYGASDRESYAFALGMDLSGTGCEESLSIRGDGIDNDCDNAADEELCNLVDDDGDGLVDEDCSLSSTEAFGNNYVMMFMENNVDDNPNAQSFLEIYLSAVDSSRTVTYNLTNELGTFPGEILPSENIEIFTNLPVSLRHIGSGIDTKFIAIEADADVIVYGINKQTWSTDGFLAFPVDVVGTEYYTSHYWPGTDLNEFGITPVTRNAQTTITVTMPTNLDASGNVASSANFGSDTIGSGQTYTFTLQFGQTAQFQGTSSNSNLNGARIVSDLPISVFSGNVRARVQPLSQQSRDHLVQQLAPVTTWRQQFVTVPIPREMDRGDVFTVTASEADTVVVVNISPISGATTQQTITLNTAGASSSFEIGSTEYGYITANRPIQLVQYVKTSANRLVDNADPAMMLIPPVEQWSRNYQFSTPQSGQETSTGSGLYKPFNVFVMIAIDNNQREGLRLDGLPLDNPSWTLIQGTNYAATTFNVTFGRHSLTHIDPNVFFEALMYGRADRESVALPIGMRLVAASCVVTTQVDGDGIDNDCDGSVDEELCNSVDDDADGQVDEDCGAGVASGTSFYLTYMDNVVENPKDFDLELYVAVVGSQKSTVSVRAPMVSFPSYEMMTEIEPGTVRGFGFTWRMRNTGQGISGNTVFVSATSDVVVYGVNKELFSNDGFLVYPESSLGTNYYTCSWSPSTISTEFAVAATADNTAVTITLPSSRADLAVNANGQTYSSGQTFSITLNRFEVYQAQSIGDLTGTRVQSSIRTAVFSGNVRANIEFSNSRDHLVEQMLATTSYGSEFYVVPFPERTVGDAVRIVARQSNTQVFLNGNSLGTIPNAGGFLSYSLASSSRVLITANSPVMVVQFVKSQDGRDNPETGDPAMFIVPSTSNMVNTATFITPIYSGGNTPGADYTNFMTVVIQNGQQGNLRLNGAPLNGVSWDSIAASSYVVGTFDVPSGSSHTLTTTPTSGARFYGRLYGKADRESYAFPVGFQF